jgi:hypothetical protein
VIHAIRAKISAAFPRSLGVVWLRDAEPGEKPAFLAIQAADLFQWKDIRPEPFPFGTYDLFVQSRGVFQVELATKKDKSWSCWLDAPCEGPWRVRFELNANHFENGEAGFSHVEARPL